MLEVVVTFKLNQKSSIHEETLMAEDHISLDVSLLETIARKLDKLGKPKEAENITIFRVPDKFRQSKENLFKPSGVSIGPFHHDRTGEEKKLRSLQDFLSREDHITLDLCLSEISKLEERTRMCYSESVPLDSKSFVQMMLFDGCFVFEYFLKWYEHRLNSLDDDMFVLSDFLLLENQIPFFIVEKLCEIGLKPDTRRDFRNHLVNVLAQAGPADDSIVPNPPAEIHHFVHLCYHCSIPIDLRKPVVSRSESFLPSIWTKIKYLLLEVFLWVVTRIFPERNSQSLPKPKPTQKSLIVIPCATQLENAGIELRPNSKPCHMVDILFCQGVLQIPTLTITNESKILLANLVAFAQYKSDEMSAAFSSFALLLDSLVHTPDDVMILRQCGIVNNYLGSDEELTDFFNQICKGVVVGDNHPLSEMFKDVNRYCESSWSKRLARWNRHRIKLHKDYFSNPWTAISLGAAVLLGLLALLQTFFQVYSYYVPQELISP